MIEVWDPPLYFAWRIEHGLPYVVHFYVAKSSRSFTAMLKSIRFVRTYFKDRGFDRVLINARKHEAQIQKVIEHHFRVKPYGEADGHQFYLLEV